MRRNAGPAGCQTHSGDAVIEINFTESSDSSTELCVWLMESEENWKLRIENSELHMFISVNLSQIDYHVCGSEWS